MSKSCSLSLALPLYQGTSPARFLFLTYPLSFGPGLWRPSDHAHSQVPPTLGPNHLLPPYPARRLQTPHLLLVTQNARAPEWLHNEDKVGLGTWIGWAAEGSSPGPSTDLELPLDHPVPSLLPPQVPPRTHHTESSRSGSPKDIGSMESPPGRASAPSYSP